MNVTYICESWEDFIGELQRMALDQKSRADHSQLQKDRKTTGYTRISVANEKGVQSGLEQAYHFAQHCYFKKVGDLPRHKGRVPTMTVGPAPDFIEKLLETGPHSKDELKKASVQEGVFDPDTAGRSIHITLVNMVRGNRIRKLPDGRYGLPKDQSHLTQTD